MASYSALATKKKHRREETTKMKAAKAPFVLDKKMPPMSILSNEHLDYKTPEYKPITV